MCGSRFSDAIDFGRLANLARRPPLAAVLVVVAACSPIAGEAGHVGGNGASASVHEASGDDLRVEVSVRVQRGELTFSVVDPDSQVRYQSDPLRAGARYKDTLPFTGAPGEWRVVFALKDAEADYEVVWRE